MAYLPQEIIFDVLSRLPVKYVLRFRCVSKSWRSLISKPQFVKTHLNRATSDLNIGCHRVLIPNNKALKSIDYESLQLLSKKEIEKARRNSGGNACTVLGFPWGSQERSVGFVASCHGMVCMEVYHHEKIVLCNPCTREFRVLPTPPICIINSDPYLDDISYGLGLGYDSYADDYKFVIIVYEYSVHETKVEMFSLRTNSWRIIHQDIPPDIEDISALGVFLNGALHWIATCRETCDQIISFDLATEQFQKIKMSPLPPRDQGDDNEIMSYDYHNLIVLGGCLSVSNRFDGETNVWVMKEYGVEASWTKLFTLNIRFNEPLHHYLRPLCISMNGQLIVDVDNEIVIYNPKYQNSRMLHSGTAGSFNVVIQYTESLVSPNGIVEND